MKKESYNFMDVPNLLTGLKKGGGKMGEKVSAKKIRERYKDEWVLILNPEISPETKVEGGEVVFHSKHRGEIHRKLNDFKGNKAIVFTGKIPEDVGVLL